MSEALQTTEKMASEEIERVLVQGDLAKLNPDQRLSYYQSVCNSIGLNSLTKPFEYITLNGKLTLYARKDATDQLRKIHGVSIRITGREQVGDCYVVTAQATTRDGRVDESVGAVAVGNLKGDNLANALMKAETKSKRRVTLSVCGLGMLDETELETIPSARPSAPAAVARDEVQETLDQVEILERFTKEIVACTDIAALDKVAGDIKRNVPPEIGKPLIAKAKARHRELTEVKS